MEEDINTKILEEKKDTMEEIKSYIQDIQWAYKENAPGKKAIENISTLKKIMLLNWPQIKRIAHKTPTYTEQELLRLYDIYMEGCELLELPLTRSWYKAFIGMANSKIPTTSIEQIILPIMEQYQECELSNGHRGNMALILTNRHGRKDKHYTQDDTPQGTSSLVSRIQEANEQSKGAERT
jgi:hypothetical protein